jgi:1-acyl-sn-glycerol-3-phosphate acyltransferase
MQPFYRVSHFLIGGAFRVAWRVRAVGRENVPLTGPVIIASNHLSFLDHFVTGGVLQRQLFFISKVQHFESKVKAFLFKRWGVIPLKRGSGDSEAFDRSREVLQRGDAFIIYPEGTRSLDGRLHKGHTGVARLALLTNSPVVPVACVGTFENLPKGEAMPKFHKVEVRFGRPLDFSKFRGKVDDRETLRQITDTVMSEIQALSGQEYVHEYQFNPEYATKERRETSKANGERLVAKKRPKVRGARPGAVV